MIAIGNRLFIAECGRGNNLMDTAGIFFSCVVLLPVVIIVFMRFCFYGNF